ncbi:M48 family metalloprotease [Terrihabitans sp. B22-R8]|uniref:M48 family metalloprotease n=1 Tax=Terrihabitans sp. B22-R8 TaxID=3425128 RepID=UPI00403D35F0
MPAYAQEGGKLSPVRDAEIEDLMRDYATPLMRAAKVDPGAVQIVLIRDFGFNAFVAGGRRIFINLGAIVESKTPNQLIGVLAHEIGHISGGHLSALRQKVDAAQSRAVIVMLLGAAAVAAGASAGAGGDTIAGAARAAATAPNEIIRRDLLSYVRSQEQAADQAAVTYLTKTGQSAKGMLEVFRGFADKSMFSARFMDPYAVTHPMPTERIALLERIAKTGPNFNSSDPPALQRRHDMARAKIIGFMKPAASVAQTYPKSDTSLPAQYARAVSTYRFGNLDVAQRAIDALIAQQPANPYFWELKGQSLLEGGRAKAAIAPLRKAVSLKPESGLIRILLGQALVDSGDPALADSAINELRQGLGRETTSASAYRSLAMIYGRKGQNAEADLASAQAAFHTGDVGLAKSLAARAKTRFSTGSPGWLRADDIINYRQSKLN